MLKASHIFMVRPLRFGFNSQTAESNSFQNKEGMNESSAIQESALKEFDAMVELLRANNIEVTVFDDISSDTPDSIFPNNWISFHQEAVVLYPMMAENRRTERRNDIIESLNRSKKTIDLSIQESEQIYLEGTGSIVFDYENRIAYANISPRTNKILLEDLCRQLNYTAITFKAVDQQGADIYHTNVLMCIGSTFCVICPDCMPDKTERTHILESLEKNGHEIIPITYAQLNSFAGNMYQLLNSKGESCIVMSKQAFNSLNSDQLTALKKHGILLTPELFTIEKFGGGSARCMMADVR